MPSLLVHPLVDCILIVKTAACCNEAFKIATAVNPNLDNYMMYPISYLTTDSAGTPETKPSTHILFSMKRKKSVLYVVISQPSETSIRDGRYMSLSKVSKRIQIRKTTEL